MREETRKADKDMLELTRLIVEQNGKILEINSSLIKIFSTPAIVIGEKKGE